MSLLFCMKLLKQMCFFQKIKVKLHSVLSSTWWQQVWGSSVSSCSQSSSPSCFTVRPPVFQGHSRPSDGEKREQDINGFSPDCSQHGRFRAAQRKQQLNSTEPAAVDSEERPGEEDRGADQKERPTQLDHGSHTGI